MSKDKATAVTPTNIKEDVLALSAKIEAGIAVDKKTGAGIENGNLYNDNLPEGLTTDTVKQVHDYNTTFVAAGTLAFGNLAATAMKSNKSLEEANISIKMGVKDKLEINMLRSKEYTNPLVENSDPVTKYGVVKANYQIQAGANKGQLKAVRNHLAELSMEYLSK